MSIELSRRVMTVIWKMIGNVTSHLYLLTLNPEGEGEWYSV